VWLREAQRREEGCSLGHFGDALLEAFRHVERQVHVLIVGLDVLVSQPFRLPRDADPRARVGGCVLDADQVRLVARLAKEHRQWGHALLERPVPAGCEAHEAVVVGIQPREEAPPARRTLGRAGEAPGEPCALRRQGVDVWRFDTRAVAPQLPA